MIYDTYLSLFNNDNKTKPTNNREYSAKIKSMLQTGTITKSKTVKKNSPACINITMKDLENKIKCILRDNDFSFINEFKMIIYEIDNNK